MKLSSDSYENPIADPAMVGQLMAAITLAIEQTCIYDVTTTADVLSALFTVLDHTLRVLRHGEALEDQAYNSQEIGRVLSDMLLEFGSATRH